MGNISHDQCPKAEQETADGIPNCQLRVPGCCGAVETGRWGEDHDCDRRTSSKAELVGFSFLSPFSSLRL